MNLHLIRPEMLWASIPLLAIVLLLLRRTSRPQQWRRAVDPELLPWLLVGDGGRRHGARNAALIAAAALLALLALAGPSWQRLPAQVQKATESLAVVLDLSPSMLAEDIKPSRITQAKFKLQDLLKLRREGRTALVVFGGDAFVVSPLTDDVETLRTLLPPLEPATMPVPGSNPLAGLQRARQLLEGAHAGNGRLLLITDGVSESQMEELKRFVAASPYPLSILAVGTEQGAPIPLPRGGFARDDSGGIIIPGLPAERLRELARTDGGRYRELSLDDSDLRELMQVASLTTERAERRQRRFDQWADAGHWFVLALLPLALLCFRRGWLLCLPLLMLPPPTQAFELRDLWQTPDQQAAAALDSDPKRAAGLFEDPHWRGIAQYRAENYEAAAETLSELDSADAHYNRGNALARAGRLEDALAAYDEALEKAPEDQDARHNRQLVEKLLQQQNREQSGGRQGQPQDGDRGDPSAAPGDGGQSGQAPSQGEASQREGRQPQRHGDSSPAEENGGDTRADGDPESSPQEQQRADDYAASAARRQKSSDTDGADSKAEMAQQPEAPRTEEQREAALAAEDDADERRQAGEQWLRKIPEDNSEFLRRKFYYQYRQRQENNEQPAPENIAPY